MTEEKDKIMILPSNYFYPFPHFLLEKNFNIKELITKDSIGIHHWERSWVESLLSRILKKILSKIKFIIINLCIGIKKIIGIK